MYINCSHINTVAYTFHSSTGSSFTVKKGAGVFFLFSYFTGLCMIWLKPRNTLRQRTQNCLAGISLCLQVTENSYKVVCCQCTWHSNLSNLYLSFVSYFIVKQLCSEVIILGRNVTNLYIQFLHLESCSSASLKS